MMMILHPLGRCKSIGIRGYKRIQARQFTSNTSKQSWLSSVFSWFSNDAEKDEILLAYSPEVDSPQKCMLIDGNNMLYQRYSPTCSMTQNGVHIGATMGFLGDLYKVIEKVKPQRICVFFDTPTITQRKLDDPTYKRDRKSMDNALRLQFPITMSVLNRLNIQIVRVPGIEADDLIASYTTNQVNEGYSVIIVSNDNDFCQLVRSTESPTVSLFKPRTKWWMNEVDVLRMIGGSSPRMHPDMRALRGDKWGKTPGLPGGISIEDSVTLLEKSGGLIPLLDELDQVEDEDIRERLHSSSEMLRTSYRATKLDDIVAIPVAATNFLLTRDTLDRLGNFLDKPELVVDHGIEQDPRDSRRLLP